MLNATTLGRFCPASLLTGCSASSKPRFLTLAPVHANRPTASRSAYTLFDFALHQVEERIAKTLDVLAQFNQIQLFILLAQTFLRRRAQLPRIQ